MLSKYAKEHHFTNTRFYVDDGYTGTNFNRPGFKQMLEDIEAGYVTTVIVKDMSRLGRNYLQVGYYNRAFCKDQFLKAVRKFMEMKTLTPTILHELVERIDVYQTQGRGKNRTQRIVIHYNFIGVLDMPEVEEYPDNVVLDSRQGVAVEYLVGKAG